MSWPSPETLLPSALAERAPSWDTSVPGQTQPGCTGQHCLKSQAMGKKKENQKRGVLWVQTLQGSQTWGAVTPVGQREKGIKGKT